MKTKQNNHPKTLLSLLFMFFCATGFAQIDFYYAVHNCKEPTPCDYIINGDFEARYVQTPANRFNSACNWRVGNISTASYYYNTSIATLPQAVNPAHGGQAYGSFVANVDPGDNSGVIATELKGALASNQAYQLRFDVLMDGTLIQGSAPNPMKIQAYLSTNSPNTGSIPVPQVTGGILMTNPTFSTNTTGWETIEFNFTTGNLGSTLKYLYLGPIYNAEYVDMNTTATASPYYIDNVTLVPLDNIKFSLPQLACGGTVIPDLSAYLIYGGAMGDYTGEFSGDGVSESGGIYSFDPAAAGNGPHIITYTYRFEDACDARTVTDTITVLDSCAIPYISQVYNDNTTHSPDDKYIEIKNESTTQKVGDGTFFLAYYDVALAPYTNVLPTSWVDIGSVQSLEAKVFRNPNSSSPGYATAFNNFLPNDFLFDGSNGIIVLTTSHDENAFTDAIDIVGNDATWSTDNSLVRSSCALTIPSPHFNAEDWEEFALIHECDDDSLRINSVLGRHYGDTLYYTNGLWVDSSTPVSRPDRSRNVEMTPGASYNTAGGGSFEACSLTLGAGVKFLIATNDYVSIQNWLYVGSGAGLDIDNSGSLVMVRDSFHGVTGTNLITRIGNMSINRTTVGLNAHTDYVYWATPLANLSANSAKNTADYLFPTTLFDPTRFFEFRNDHFQDIPNYFSYMGTTCTSCSYANGYDDNLDDYHPLDTTQRAAQLTAGLGYATWTPDDGQNYNIHFEGTPNNGVLTAAVSHTAPSNTFSNLVGNPYPCAIDLDKLFAVNDGLIDPYAMIWGRTADDPSATIPGPYVLSYTEDNFLIYNPTMMTIPNSSGNTAFNDLDFDTVSDSGMLSSCQSFFVNTTTTGGNLIFNNSMRVKESNSTFAKMSNTAGVSKLWLDLKNDTKTNQLGIAFKDSASDDFSSKEDVKAIRNSKTTFYSIAKDTDLIINVLGTFNSSKVIPLGVTTAAETGTSMTVSIDKKQGEVAHSEIYIYDKLNNTFTDITKTDFKFKVTNAIMDDRFVLVFDKGNYSLDLPQTATVDVTNKDHNVTVTSQNRTKIKSINVYDIYSASMNGNLLAEIKNSNKNEEHFYADPKCKILLLTITLDDGRIINKKIMN